MERTLVETLNHFICGHLLVLDDAEAQCAACGHKAPYTVFQQEPWCPMCETTISFCAMTGSRLPGEVLQTALDWRMIMPRLTCVGAVEKYADGLYRIVVEAPLPSELE